MACQFTSANTESFSRSVATGPTIMSFSAWILPTDFAALQSVVGVTRAATGADRFWIDVNTDGTVNMNTEAQLATSTATVNSGGWHHVAGYSNGNSDRSIFVDGTETNSTGATSVSTTADQFQIGIQRTSNPFNGQIAEVAYWEGTQLTDAEFAQLAAGAPPMLFNPTEYHPLTNTNDTTGWISATALTNNNTVTDGTSHPPIWGIELPGVGYSPAPVASGGSGSANLLLMGVG